MCVVPSLLSVFCVPSLPVRPALFVRICSFISVNFDEFAPFNLLHGQLSSHYSFTHSERPFCCTLVHV